MEFKVREPIKRQSNDKFEIKCMDICTNYPQKRTRRSRIRKKCEAKRGGCAGWQHLKKRNFCESGSRFLDLDFGFIKLVQERREIYTLATNCSISMGFLEIVGRRRHLKPLIFNLINGAVGEVAVCLSNWSTLRGAGVRECEGGGWWADYLLKCWIRRGAWNEFVKILILLQYYLSLNFCS